MFAKELFIVSYLSTNIPPGRYPMTQTGLECLFLEIMYVFRILNFGHCDLLGIRAAQAVAPLVIFVIWNLPPSPGRVLIFAYSSDAGSKKGG